MGAANNGIFYCQKQYAETKLPGFDLIAHVATEPHLNLAVIIRLSILCGYFFIGSSHEVFMKKALKLQDRGTYAIYRK
jgi:hypothetical protein